MQPRITVITLGVDDLERAVRFYRDGLGLPTKGIVGTEFAHGAVAFFDLQAGLRLALWPRASLAHARDVAGVDHLVREVHRQAIGLAAGVHGARAELARRLEELDRNAPARVPGMGDEPLEGVQALGAHPDDRDAQGLARFSVRHRQAAASRRSSSGSRPNSRSTQPSS